MDLRQTLADHALWLSSNCRQGQRANLRGAHLSGADLRGANFQDVIFADGWTITRQK